MGNLLLILGVLFVGLIVMVKVAEWQSAKQTEENKQSIQKMSRWILPLLAIGLVVQIITHMMHS